MGMSASQARLLSITARINHVELETQYLSNAKIRLSDSTQKASDKYVAALNKTEYQYNYYNAAGEKITMDLTGAALTEYGELKNQYGLINAAGQILVSETDAANFENSNTLEEFLEKYGVLGDLGEGDIIQVTNPEYEVAWDEYYDEYNKWMAEKPDPTDPIYIIPGQPSTEQNLYDDFLWANAVCYGETMAYLSTSLGLGGGSLYDSEGRLVVSYDENGFVAYDTSGNELASEPIQSWAKECYSHVLDHLLLIGNYTTTTGDSLSITSSSHWWLSGSLNDRGGKAAALAGILSESAETVLYACGDNGEDITQESSDIEKLMSDYYFDENGDKQLKTLQQKMVDLNYANISGLLSNQELYDAIQHFVNHDLTVLNEPEDEFDKDAYLEDLAEWEAKGEEIKEPDVPQFIDQEVRKIEDLDKAQWYVNLWHRMNGTSDFKAGFGNSEDYIAGNGWASKSETDQNWAVLKDGDMNSPEYLKYAIENGLITIEQVQFTDPSESGSGIENAVWTSIVFSSAQDITEQKDQVAITIAETEYNQTLREIEAKDKEYDTQIKKLDTEHNALQTEYDSIKSVIEKNVERSFKIFS